MDKAKMIPDTLFTTNRSMSGYLFQDPPIMTNIYDDLDENWNGKQRVSYSEAWDWTPNHTRNVLAASIGQTPYLTFNYRITGMGSFTLGDQFCWVEAKRFENLLHLQGELYLNLLLSITKYIEAIAEESIVEYEALLSTTASQHSCHQPSFAEYMKQIEELAMAYDQEAVSVSKEEFEHLYDAAFFEALEFEKKSP